jgi:hypothetical protein
MRPEGDEMNTELAKRLSSHWRWKWMGGMLAIREIDGRPSRAYRQAESIYALDRKDDLCKVSIFAPTLENQLHEIHYPDLDDPATQGCLFAMLVAACNAHPVLYGDGSCSYEIRGPVIRGMKSWTSLGADTVAEALLTAWEMEA